MSPAARALPGLGIDVVHDVIVVRFPGNDYWIDATGHVVEFEQVTRLPRNVVIGARVIARNPEAADDPAVSCAERNSTAKDVYTAGRATD